MFFLTIILEYFAKHTNTKNKMFTAISISVEQFSSLRNIYLNTRFSKHNYDLCINSIANIFHYENYKDKKFFFQ